jgi:hypothetical protein
VFAYNKNYAEIVAGEDLTTPRKEGEISQEISHYKVFTMDFIIKQTLDFGEDEGESRVRRIAHWKLKTTENVLKSLLIHHMDRIAK